MYKLAAQVIGRCKFGKFCPIYSQGLSSEFPRHFHNVSVLESLGSYPGLDVTVTCHVPYAMCTVCPPEEDSEVRQLTEQQLRKVIAKKLVAYKRQDQTKGLRFDLKVDHILHLKDDRPQVHPAGTDNEREGIFSSRRPTARSGTVEEGFCATKLAFMASDGFLPVSLLISLFNAATTSGKRATFSADLSEDPRAASNIS